MEFVDVIRLRRSVRRFQDRPVEDEKLTYLLEAARLAPSASNRQPARFVVVRNPATIAVIGKPVAMINRWLASAPAIIVVCAQPGLANGHHGVDFSITDAAVAAEHIVLAATDQGLGTCWVGMFHEAAVRRELKIPGGVRIVAMLAVGYAADETDAVERMQRAAIRADRRKPLEEIAHWETW